MTSASSAVRIVVADDHHVVRTGFAALLDTQPDFAVVGFACDGTEAVRICRELSPNVVLMDVRMPVMDGIEATRQLAGAGPDGSPGPRILILTTFDLDRYVYDALCAGASGFLLKDVTAERLFEAVRVIAAGEALLAPAVTRRLISEFTRLRPRPETAAAGALATLTPRETQVLRLVAEGLSNPEVAARLVVTEETVKTHVSRILTKLGLRDRTQAVVTAYELGLVVPGSRDPDPGPSSRLSALAAGAALADSIAVRHRPADRRRILLAEGDEGQRGAVEHQRPAGCVTAESDGLDVAGVHRARDLAGERVQGGRSRQLIANMSFGYSARGRHVDGRNRNIEVVGYLPGGQVEDGNAAGSS